MDKQRDRKLAETVRQQQHTGNHDKPGKPAGGADRFGGTRAGAENVEPGRDRDREPKRPESRH